MATNSITGASFSMRSLRHHFNPTLAIHSSYGRRNVSFCLRPRSVRLKVSCAAKPEENTTEKVCKIVRKQLALPDDSNLTGESKFASLGADSLDTVEIVMRLEEEFGIAVEEDSAQRITTVQEAADLIDEILKKQSP